MFIPAFSFASPLSALIFYSSELARIPHRRVGCVATTGAQHTEALTKQASRALESLNEIKSCGPPRLCLP